MMVRMHLSCSLANYPLGSDTSKGFASADKLNLVPTFTYLVAKNVTMNDKRTQQISQSCHRSQRYSEFFIATNFIV
jgi:hypothetical protein